MLLERLKRGSGKKEEAHKLNPLVLLHSTKQVSHSTTLPGIEHRAQDTDVLHWLIEQLVVIEWNIKQKLILKTFRPKYETLSRQTHASRRERFLFSRTLLYTFDPIITLVLHRCGDVTHANVK